MRRSRFGHFPLISAEDPSVNLTPLIDVVFVVLIMFIVIAPLLELDRIELAEAPRNAADPTVSLQDKSPITVHVQGDNRLYVDGREISLMQLKQYFKEAKVRYPKAVPQLIHDRRAQFGTYQSVKNAAEEAGFQQMEIVLKPN